MTSQLENAKKWLSEMHIVLSKQTQKVSIDHAMSRIEIVEWLVDRVDDLESINKELHQRRRGVRKQNKRYREAIENTQIAIQKNLAKRNYKDEEVLYEVYMKNKQAMGSESE